MPKRRHAWTQWVAKVISNSVFFCFTVVSNYFSICFVGGENVGISYCHGLGGNQVFAYTKRQQIMSDDNCLDATGTDGIVKLIRCHGMGGNQAWLYEAQVFDE
jgi:hypothetical protein